MKDEKREIVSLRMGKTVVIGEVQDESPVVIYFDDGIVAGAKITKARADIIHRNLATLPHKDFGRKCEVDGEEGYFCHMDGTYPRIMRKSGRDYMGVGSITFLDELPRTHEFDGKVYDFAKLKERCKGLEPEGVIA